VQPFPTFSYDASKAAVHHITRHLSWALAESRVTCNVLAPGWVPTKMGSSLQVYGQSESELAATIPLRRPGATPDMAGLCIYFASAAGAWTTGTAVPVDGGQTASRGQKMAAKKPQAKL
jgi:NAD(P)-dependent dehydrogenase (short-subunit alcohol dehydrogenase family)